ncbi:MAG: alpha/beta hydrolase [Candidatus Omnitrophica bacterium]|nr:alpha/beta hydrolase [Candidatus Omnitrophota bacterium]
MCIKIDIKKIMGMQINLGIAICLLFAAFLFYLKNFEKNNIFYPSRKISATPKDAGLDYEDVSFSASLGSGPQGKVTLNGWFIQGKSQAPVILFCHGNAGNISHRIPLLELFHQAGFSVFIFDYRGYGRSTGRPSEQGIYDDAFAAYQYLLKEKYVSPGDVIIYGESIGTQAAVDLASRAPAGLLVLYSGFSSAADMGKAIFPWFPEFLLRALSSVKFDSLSKIKQISIPKLIIHSREDEMVPFRLGEKLFAAAKAPKEFLIMRGGHNEGAYAYQEEFIRAFTAFVNKYSRK